MNKKELEKLISEMERKVNRERKMREYLVIAAFTVVFFLLYCFLVGTPDKLGEAVAVFISSFMLSALHCGINQAIFEHLNRKQEAVENELKALKKQLSDINAKELDERIQKYKKE